MLADAEVEAMLLEVLFVGLAASAAPVGSTLVEEATELDVTLATATDEVLDCVVVVC